MLHFIFGRSGSGKTHYINNLLAQKSKLGSPKLMLIVPEQNSFYSECSTLNLLGEAHAHKIDIMSFSRLVDFVSLSYGKSQKKRLDSGDRAMLMSLAIESVQDNLKIYSGGSNKPEIIDFMISALTEFKLCSIGTDALMATASTLQGGTLKDKLVETSLILNAFDALLSQSYVDPLDDLSHLYHTLSDSTFFCDYEVFIDGFDGFTTQQMKILEVIFKQSKNCYISFCTDESLINPHANEIDLSLFSQVNKSIKKVINIAKGANVSIAPYKFLNENFKIKPPALKFLESQIFKPQKEKFSGSNRAVCIYSAASLYDEADFVCKTIKKLVSENDYRYNDFAIVCRNQEIYRGIINSYLENYEIPFFMDIRENVDSKPLMSLAIHALEVVTTGFSSDSIFKYLKTGLVGLDTDEISILENYTLLWSITGAKWFAPFTANPSGFREDNKSSDMELLEKINCIREKIIAPLFNFSEKVKSADGKGISVALYELLEEICIRENLQQYVKALLESGNPSLAEEQPRLWDLLVNIIDKFSSILENKFISVKRFTELLKLVIQSNDIAFIPQYLDQVTIGSADRIKPSDIKVAFVVGAVEGEFPRTPAVAGIFSDFERKTLLSLGLGLYDSLQGLALNERFLAYRAVSMPSEKLYISYPRATSLGASKSPSSIVRETRYILKNVVEMHAQSEISVDEIFALKPAFELCAKHFNDYTEFSETLKKYFSENEEYSTKINTLNKITEKKDFSLSEKIADKKLFGNEIKLSASQIEQFYMCKFAYFCKYVMLAKERRPAKFDALEYGNLTHFILEHMLSNFSYKEILEFEESALYAKVTSVLNNYVNKKLGGTTDKSARFNYLLSRVRNSAVPLIIHLAKELEQCSFSPDEFELELSKKSKIKPLKVTLQDGTNVYVEGKIDRVDVLKNNGVTYVRIIDYKTGVREFSLNDVVYGLNMQMLLYMAAIWQNSTGLYKNIVPAGILHMPAKTSVVSANRDVPDQKLDTMKMKQLKMNGLLLNDPEVIVSMEKDAGGIFIPASFKNGEPTRTSSVVSLKELTDIIDYTKTMVAGMASDLKSGVIPSVPTVGTKKACDFCSYKSICLFEDGDNVKEIKKLDKDRIAEQFSGSKEGENIV